MELDDREVFLLDWFFLCTQFLGPKIPFNNFLFLFDKTVYNTRYDVKFY